MTTDMLSAEDTHKRQVALGSVLAAILLTLTKIVVGVLTGSLGILAEAAHSALDLVAALVTYLAVRISGQPADEGHPYGHGKVENLSALFETLLLLGTCVWIIYEAGQRLLTRHVTVEANLWAFAVMALSIVVDFSRSRALMKAAKAYDSQALEADAIHFSTDIWSSAVVIGGLILVRLGMAIPSLAILERADAVAALGVALIVLYVSTQLGRRTISVLLDTAPVDVADRIRGRVGQLQGVDEVGQVRVRRAGPDAFVDLTVALEPDLSLEQGHQVANRVEEVVGELLPRSDVVVHTEPFHADSDGYEGAVNAVRGAAASLGLRVHGLRLLEVGDGYRAEVHVELGPGLNLSQAHEKVSQFEAEVRVRYAGIADIVTHIEPGPARGAPEIAAPAGDDMRRLADEAREIATARFGPGSCHKVRVHSVEGRPSVSLHCVLPADLSLDQAHDLTEEFEDELRLRFPDLDRVIVHAEPPLPEQTPQEP